MSTRIMNAWLAVTVNASDYLFAASYSLPNLTGPGSIRAWPAPLWYAVLCARCALVHVSYLLAPGIQRELSTSHFWQASTRKRSVWKKGGISRT